MNNSLDPVTVSFSLVYTLSADASATEPGGFAFANTALNATSGAAVELVDEFLFSFSDPTFSNGLVQARPTLASFSLVVASGNSDSVDHMLDTPIR